jgi:KUP system potassium uptake protein
LWRFGKESQWQAEAEDRFKPSYLVRTGKDGQLQLTDKFGGDALSPIRGFGIFFDKAGVLTPTVFTQFVSKLVAVPEVMVFLHLRPLEMPTVPESDRYAVSNFSIPGCYRLVIRHGYMDEVVTPQLDRLVYDQVRSFIIRKAAEKKQRAGLGDHNEKDATATTASASEKASTSGSGGKTPEDVSTAAELEFLDKAYSARIMYIIGKEQMKIRHGTKLWRKVLLGTFLWIRDNTRTKIANWPVQMERVVEVGFVKDV